MSAQVLLQRNGVLNSLLIVFGLIICAVLAAPVDGRLFFAGEATSPEFFSTAHGARDSGERAAKEVLASRASE